MTARLRYLGLLALRTRGPLPAAAATLFVLLGVYAYRPNDVEGSFSFTAFAATALVAWLTQAVLRAEPPAQADGVTAVLGGRAARLRLEAELVVALALLVAALALAYPLAFGLLERTPSARELVDAALAHVCCGLCGGALAVALGPARVLRPATAAAATVAGLVAAAAVIGTPVAVGPGAVAARVADGAGPLAACGGALVLAAALLAGAWAWSSRFG